MDDHGQSEGRQESERNGDGDGLPAERSISVEELEAALRAADGAVFLVRPRVLRRVIRASTRAYSVWAHVPHGRCFVADGSLVRGIVTGRELGVDPERVPRQAILLRRPRRSELARQSRAPVLRRWWRDLFHARVHAVLEHPARRTGLDQAQLRERIDRLGQTFFDEVRSVLREENVLLPPHNDYTEYVEFAALYLELRAFAPHWLPRYFPDLPGESRVLEILGRDVDPEALLRATCPQEGLAPLSAQKPDVPRARLGAKRAGRHRPAWARRLLLRADRSEARGNLVRTALLRQRAAAQQGEDGSTNEVGRDAARSLSRLVMRLKSALALGREEAAGCQALIEGLLPAASHGFRSHEARLLFDLQKICVDHERGVWVVDLWAWVRSRGRRPLKRPLPHQREVLMTRHLRRARKRLPSVVCPARDREQLEALLDRALADTDHRLRKRMRPAVREVLERTGLEPANVAERISRDKLVEELLDRVAHRGFLALGDVRDAVSRNQLKLPDAGSPRDVWTANHLLEVDRGLARGLEGVYRRAEFYLRYLQRLSALAFGSRPGRFFSLFVAIPFGGAFMTLAGLQALLGPVFGLLLGVHPVFIDPWYVSVFALGLYFVLLIHVAGVRRATAREFRRLGGGLKWMVYEVPWALARHPVLRRVLESKPWIVLWRSALLPAVLAAAVVFPLRNVMRPEAWRTLAVGIFLLASVLLNTPFGALIREWLLETSLRVLSGLRGTLVTGLIRLIIALFRGALEWIETILYSVDEWLRFRTGESRLTLAGKAVLGVFWGVVTYVVRLYVNLLLEPQVNPVKHFPVVTVSHKIMVPFVVPMTKLLASVLTPLGPVIANTVAGTTIFLLPGFFGFLVWELKENWRLFEANRERRLGPVLVGDHGETLPRLLRPGFHSGTLPKAYAKLRRAERASTWTGEPVSARIQREVIHHVEISVSRFFERELIALLHATPSWKGLRLCVDHVSAASNALEVQISSRKQISSRTRLSNGAKPWSRRLPGGGPVVRLEEQSGWIVASIPSPGWLDRVDDEARRAFRDALAGIYKRAGVGLVREQIAVALGPEPPPYDVADQGLIVWPGPGYETEEVHPLEATAGHEGSEARPLDARRLLFSGDPITWASWTDAWEAHEDRAGPGPLIAGDATILPPR